MTTITNKFEDGQLEALEALGLSKEASIGSLVLKGARMFGGGATKALGSVSRGAGKLLGNTLSAKGGSALMRGGNTLKRSGSNLIAKGRAGHMQTVVRDKNLMRGADGLRPAKLKNVKSMRKSMDGAPVTKPNTLSSQDRLAQMQQRAQGKANVKSTSQRMKSGNEPGRKSGVSHNEKVTADAIRRKQNIDMYDPRNVTAGQYPGVMQGVNTAPVGASNPFVRSYNHPPLPKAKAKTMPSTQDKAFDWMKANPVFAGNGGLAGYGMYRQPSGGATIVNN